MRRGWIRTWGGVLVAAQLALPACSTMSEWEKQAWGAVGGAIVGAAAGAAVADKKNRKGAMIIGAAAGAAAGYLLATQFGAKATPEQRTQPEFQEAQKDFDRGREAQDAGRNDEAVAHYEAAAAKAPEQPEPHVNMGYAHLDRNDRIAAERSFRRALAIDPTNAEAKAGLDAMGLPS